jgi:hypothetical protein
VPEHRLAADRIENLGEGWVLHSLALSGSKDYCGKGAGRFSGRYFCHSEQGPSGRGKGRLAKSENLVRYA